MSDSTGNNRHASASRRLLEVPSDRETETYTCARRRLSRSCSSVTPFKKATPDRNEGSRIRSASLSASFRRGPVELKTMRKGGRQEGRCGNAWIRYSLLYRSEEHTSELQSLRHLVC